MGGILSQKHTKDIDFHQKYSNFQYGFIIDSILANLTLRVVSGSGINVSISILWKDKD